jgi:DNA-binding winged helix-turn-helix (wHTH) protein
MPAADVNGRLMMNPGRIKSELARTFLFGPFYLIPVQQLLLEGEKPLRVGSRAIEILIALVERHGELVTREELMARVWPNLFVEPSNLTVHIAALRRALGDGLNGHRYLVNIPGRGYRFVAQVSTVDEEMPGSAQRSAAAAHPDTCGVHGPSARSVDSLQLLMGRQEARDSTKVPGTRGFDRNRCARCPLAKTCEPRVFYN